ncbi:MAG: DNA primase [Verrucomicrobiota bacterium]
MPRIKESCIDEVRARASLVELVQDYTQLKRAGSEWKGLSPFTNEKSPSFFVNDGKNVFHCYSTDEKGDVFRFLELKEHLSFVEAVEFLARRFSVSLEYEQETEGQRANRGLRQELYALHDLAANYFRTCFETDGDEGVSIRDYWTNSRGFTIETAVEFKIGYAPADDGDCLLKKLRKRFSSEVIRESGLYYHRESDRNLKWAKARFQGRLMIPILDAQGRCCAFTARQTAATPPEDPAREAKYVNSPETRIFKKGRLLFNLDRARRSIREGDAFLMVEGQLDAIRCHSVGLLNAIAPQGTAVTADQLTMLRRYSSNLNVLLDGDSAGRKAGYRLLAESLKSGLDLTFLSLPESSDPDELLRERGARAIDELSEAPLSAMEIAVQSLLPKTTEASARAKGVALDEIYKLLINVDEITVREGYLKEVARLINVKFSSAQKDAERAWSASASAVAPRPPRKGASKSRVSRPGLKIFRPRNGDSSGENVQKQGSTARKTAQAVGILGNSGSDHARNCAPDGEFDLDEMLDELDYGQSEASNVDEIDEKEADIDEKSPDLPRNFENLTRVYGHKLAFWRLYRMHFRSYWRKHNKLPNVLWLAGDVAECLPEFFPRETPEVIIRIIPQGVYDFGFAIGYDPFASKQLRNRSTVMGAENESLSRGKDGKVIDGLIHTHTHTPAYIRAYIEKNRPKLPGVDLAETEEIGGAA